MSIKRFNESSDPNTSNPKTPEQRLEEYVNNILEDLNKISKEVNRVGKLVGFHENDIKKIKGELDGIHNMIVNDQHYVFHPERLKRNLLDA